MAAVWKSVWAVAVILATAAPTWAERVALVIGNRDYRDLAPLSGADRVVGAAAALRDQDVAVIVGQDSDLAEMRALLSQFEQMASRADGLLVVLAGRFVAGGNDTFFLPVDSDMPGLTALPGQSVPISLVLQLLAAVPGQAFLVLAEDGRTGPQGPFLKEGIGDLSIPQGVTVLRGGPGAVADALRDTLAVPDRAVALAPGLDVTGFLPVGHGFLQSGATGAGPGQARDQAAAEARIDALTTRIAGLDAALWAEAQAEDSVAGYTRYLKVFPDGSRAAEAGRIIRDIQGEPFRRDRLAEEALGLTRDERRAMQRNLTELGFNTRGIDGIFGPGTRGAIRAWQSDTGRVASGYLDGPQISDLTNAARAAEQARLAEEEARRVELALADRRFWQDTGAGASEAGLREYLARFPRGIYAEEARRRLAAMDDEPPNDQTEETAWRRAEAANTIAAYRDFLDRFPNGRHGDTARDRIAALEGRGSDGRRQAEAAENALNLGRIARVAIENQLAALGFDPGALDGTFDRRTRRAIANYQAANGLPETGYVSQLMVVRLALGAIVNGGN